MLFLLWIHMQLHLSLHGLSPNIVDQYILFVVWLYDLPTEIANIENSWNTNKCNQNVMFGWTAIQNMYIMYVN